MAKGSSPAGSVFRKNSFYLETRGTRRGGGRHVAKHSSDPREDFPEFELQGRDLTRVVVIVAPSAPVGAGSRGKFILSSPRENLGPVHMCRVALTAESQGRAR